MTFRIWQVGFYEIKMRNAGRYDLQLPQFEEERFSYLTTAAPWLPFVRAALGADAIVTVRLSTSSVMEGAAEILAYGTAVKLK